MYGQHEAAWLAFYEFFSEVCGLTEQTRKLDGLWKASRNAGWFMPFAEICFVAERHNIARKDDRGRLHCENGPACAYPDGWGVWAWHGVRVNRYIVEEPSKITVQEIETEGNAEVRRVMIERYGSARYMQDSGAKEIHRDEFGILLRKDVAADEPIVMVKVVNSTAEPDGSFKDYFIRVPPNIQRAKEGIAWTFEMREEDYDPACQT